MKLGLTYLIIMFLTLIKLVAAETIQLDCKFESNDMLIKIDIDNKIVEVDGTKWEVFNITDEIISIGRYYTGQKSRNDRREENLANAIDSYLEITKTLFPNFSLEVYDEKIILNRYTLNSTLYIGREFNNKQANLNKLIKKGNCSLRGNRKI